MAAHGGALVEGLTFPFLAAIAPRHFFIRTRWPVNMTYTGVLVGKKWILTVAHGPGNVRAQLNTINLREPGGKIVEVRRIVAHPGYDDLTHVNDIALLELESEVRGVEPVGIATSQNWRTSPGNLIHLGFGRNGSNGFDGRLRRRDVALCPGTVCAEAYSTPAHPVTDAHFCVCSPNSSADEGDSGGPILQLDPAGKPLLVGVMSQSFLTAGHPDLCIDVSQYQPWIVSMMENRQTEFKALWSR